jgi:hypothetical protein
MVSFARPNSPPEPPKGDDPSVQALFEEIDAEVKAENVKKFFQRYGNIIAIALLAVVLGTAGFNMFGTWLNSQREKETAVLISLMDRNPGAFTDEELKQVLETLVQLGKKGHSEGVRFASAITEISILMKKDQKDAALLRMAELSKTGDFSPMYREYIQIQSIRLRADSEDSQKLLAELGPMVKEDSPWYFSAAQLTAMLEAKTGNTEQAIKRLQVIIDAPEAPLVAREEAGQLLRLYKAM